MNDLCTQFNLSVRSIKEKTPSEEAPLTLYFFAFVFFFKHLEAPHPETYTIVFRLCVSPRTMGRKAS